MLCHSKIFKSNFKLLKNVKRFCISPDFTKNNYNVSRGPYRYIEERHINYFREILGEKGIITDLSDLEKFNVDHWRQYRGKSTIALRPSTTEQISKILSFCNNELLAVVPQGGNTGLCGAATPVFDEIVICTELMNKIIHLDETSGVLICQSGCILGNLNRFLESHNLMMPIDLGAKDSCHIGGNISTNAGGLRLLRYGNLHANVLGLEVVKADGEVLDLLSTLKKDNTGYHLKHIFIGAEGTLGYITKVAIQCPPKPKNTNVAFMGVQKFEKVVSTFKKAKYDLGEILSAFEVMDTPTMQMTNEHMNLTSPIGDYPFYVLLETSGSNERHDQEKLDAFLDECLLKHLILNGIVATEPSKQKEIWDIREKSADACQKDGYTFKYDVTLSLEHYYKMVEDARIYAKNKTSRVTGYGHLGDGNLHLQFSVPKFTKELNEFFDEFVYDYIKKVNGSFSAEHGIGFMKTEKLKTMKSKAEIQLMKEMKKLLDPNNIMNPYKVISN